MNRKITGLAGLAAALVTAAGCASQSHPIRHQASTPSPSASSASAAASAQAPAPAPKGTSQTSCDTVLGAGLNDPNYLTGEVDLTNTGNIGDIVQIVFHWKQEGGSDVTMAKTVHLPYGHSKQVNFRYYAGTGLSTPALDANQSWEERHSFRDPCTSHVRITGTYGSAR